MTFGENIKALRIARSLSQKDLAEALGFSFQNISKWERDESRPDIDTLLAIARFFGTTTDALLGHSVEKAFSSLAVEEREVKLYREYPDKEENVGEKLIFVIEGNGKIAALVFVPHGRSFEGYLREGYDPFDQSSTVIYNCSYRRYKETGSQSIEIRTRL